MARDWKKDQDLYLDTDDDFEDVTVYSTSHAGKESGEWDYEDDFQENSAPFDEAEDWIDEDAWDEGEGWDEGEDDEEFIEVDDSGRPVRKLDTVADDPLADSDLDEDIYSGKYRRENSAQESEMRRKKRSRKKRGKVLLVILILLALAAIAAVAAMALLRERGVSSFVSTTPAATEAAASEEAVTTAAETTEAETEPALVWEKDANDTVKELVGSYYQALAAGDAAKLGTILDPSVTVNAEQIAQETEYIEDYKDIETYVTDGANEGEYAVYVSYAMKFKDIDTPAPGLVPAYVRPDSEGNARLLRHEDFDKTVSSFMGSISQSKEVKELADSVDQAFHAAQDSDAKLKSFIAALSGEPAETQPADASQASGEPAQSEDGSQPAEEQAGEEQGGEPASSQAASETETTTAAAAAGEETDFRTVDDIQYTTTQVKLRKKAILDNETQDYTILTEGTWVHVIGVGDKWCKVVTKNGTTGYVYKEYLTPDRPAGSGN